MPCRKDSANATKDEVENSLSPSKRMDTPMEEGEVTSGTSTPPHRAHSPDPAPAPPSSPVDDPEGIKDFTWGTDCDGRAEAVEIRES